MNKDNDDCTFLPENFSPVMLNQSGANSKEKHITNETHFRCYCIQNLLSCYCILDFEQIFFQVLKILLFVF